MYILTGRRAQESLVPVARAMTIIDTLIETLEAKHSKKLIDDNTILTLGLDIIEQVQVLDVVTPKIKLEIATATVAKASGKFRDRFPFRFVDINDPVLDGEGRKLVLFKLLTCGIVAVSTDNDIFKIKEKVTSLKVIKKSLQNLYGRLSQCESADSCILSNKEYKNLKRAKQAVVESDLSWFVYKTD